MLRGAGGPTPEVSASIHHAFAGEVEPELDLGREERRHLLGDAFGKEAGNGVIDANHQCQRNGPDLPAREIEHDLVVGRLGAVRPDIAQHRLDDPNLDPLRDLDLDFMVVDLDDLADQAAAGDRGVARFHPGDHRLMLLDPPLLRPDQEEIEMTKMSSSGKIWP